MLGKGNRRVKTTVANLRLASPVESQGHNSGFSFMERNAGIEMLSSVFSLTGKLGCPAGINPE